MDLNKYTSKAGVFSLTGHETIRKHVGARNCTRGTGKRKVQWIFPWGGVDWPSLHRRIEWSERWAGIGGRRRRHYRLGRFKEEWLVGKNRNGKRGLVLKLPLSWPTFDLDLEWTFWVWNFSSYDAGFPRIPTYYPLLMLGV